MAPLSRRQKQKQERLELFIDIAEKLFLDRGYDGTTIDGVARAAQFSKRTVYLYFADKHELFSAVLLRGLGRLKQRIESALSEKKGGRQRILAFAREYGHTMLEQPDFFELLMRFERHDFHYRKSGDAYGPFGQDCLSLNSAIGELLYDAIRLARAEGSLEIDLDPPQFSLLTFAAFTGVLQVGVWRREILPEVYGLTAEELLEEAIQLLMPSQWKDDSTHQG